MGLSRIYLRAHYASDVIAGEALAVAMYALALIAAVAWQAHRDSAIGDPLDGELMNVIRIVEERDDSSAAGSLLLTLHDRVAAMEELEPSDVDMSEPDQVAIWKTVQVLMNKTIYTDNYLR